MDEISCQYTPIKESFFPNSNLPKRFSFCVDDTEDTICVYVRLKPDETRRTGNFLSYDESENIVKLKKKSAEHEYKFTKIFPPETTQDDIFEICAKPNLQKFLKGQSTFIFTYGASNSGKSFTAQGTKSAPGIIPRSLATVFHSLKDCLDPSSLLCPERGSTVIALDDEAVHETLSYKQKIITLAKNMMPQISKSENFIPFSEYEQLVVDKLNMPEQSGLYSIWLTFYEIYNEKIYDVFEEPKETKKPLLLVTDKDSAAFVKGLKHIPVTNLYEAFLLYSFGQFNLSINSTAVNLRSSRSHAIFSIKIVGRPEDNVSSYFISTSYSVCDLAGTERASKTKNQGVRLKEAQQINASILFFNKCLRIIRENQNTEIKKHVPYRESKLTQILGRSFTCGDTSLAMVVTISQNDQFQEDTETTLRSSSIATAIKALPPPQSARRRKMRFSMAISNAGQGDGPVDWKVVAACSKNERYDFRDQALRVKTEYQNCDTFRTLYPPGFVPDVYKELEEERKKKQAAEERLQEREEMHREEVARLVEKINKLGVEKDKKLEQMLEEAEEECMQYRAEVLKLKKVIRILREEKEEKTNQIEQLESTNESYKNMLDDAKEDLEILQEEIADKDKLIALKNEEIGSLESDKMALEELMKNYSGMEDELSDKIMEIERLQLQLQGLSDELELYKNSNKDLVNKNKECIEDLQKAWEEIDGYRRQIEILEHEKESFEQNKQEIIRRYEAILDQKNIKEDKESRPQEKNTNKETHLKAKEEKSHYSLRTANMPKILVDGRPLRTRSQERRASFSDDNEFSEDPSFTVPRNLKSRTTGKKKRPKTKRLLSSSAVPDYSGTSQNTTASGATDASSGRSRRKLFMRSSSDLGNADSIRTSDIEESPETYLKRVLRTGKKY